MSAMFGGSSQSQHATNAFTMPQSQLRNTPFAQMLPGMMTGINALLSGQAAGSAATAATKASNMNLTTGIQGLKQSFAGSGMGQSTAMMSGINQMTQQAGVNLANVVGGLTLQSLQAGVGDVLSMAAGTGNQWGSQFGWNAGISMTGTYGQSPQGPYSQTTIA